MSSLVYDIGEKSRKVARFMGTVRREVQKAVAHEKVTRRLTQQQIADLLGTSKSVINREILGGNLTLRRLGELAWALGWEINFEFRKPVVSGQNQIISTPNVAGQIYTREPQTTAATISIIDHKISTTTSASA